jgi:hypothetical protein
MLLDAVDAIRRTGVVDNTQRAALDGFIKRR